jgi:serine/threonine-protein phosphatase Stp1
MTDYRIDETAVSHVGCVRKDNEDSHFADPAAGVWVVADGMGGHSNGKLASEAVVRSVASAELPEAIEDACESLSRAIGIANTAIFEHAGEEGVQMGTTVVALVLRADEFAVVWAGDSRAYVLRDGALIQLTRDHTQVEEMLARGLLTQAEALEHPMKHVLSRAVGVQPKLELEAVRDRTRAGDVFLLCSDGLHGVIGEDGMIRALAESGPKAAEELIEATLANGAPDNVTVIVVALHETTLLKFGSAFA